MTIIMGLMLSWELGLGLGLGWQGLGLRAPAVRAVRAVGARRSGRVLAPILAE